MPAHVCGGDRWVEHPERGWLPEFFVGSQTVPAAQEGAAVFGIAWRTGLRRERRHLGSALLTVREIFFKAQMVRAALDVEHLKALTNEEEVSVARAQELTRQTLNDLAYLYSAHLGEGPPGSFPKWRHSGSWKRFTSHARPI